MDFQFPQRLIRGYYPNHYITSLTGSFCGNSAYTSLAPAVERLGLCISRNEAGAGQMVAEFDRRISRLRRAFQDQRP